jgi:hypothetical protein
MIEVAPDVSTDGYLWHQLGTKDGWGMLELLGGPLIRNQNTRC